MTFSFVKVGDKTTWRAVGFWIGFILQAVLVCVTACLGSALLPQFSSAEMEASSGNAPCELQWTCLDTGTRRGRRKPHCKVFGKVLGDWAMKKWRKCLLMVGTETFLGWGRDRRWLVLLSVTGLLSEAGHIVELYVHIWWREWDEEGEEGWNCLAF